MSSSQMPPGEDIFKTPPCRLCGHPHSKISGKCAFLGCRCIDFQPIPEGTIGFREFRMKRSVIPRMLILEPEPPRAA